MLSILEVPHESRKDFLQYVYEEGWDVGREEENGYRVVLCSKVFYSPKRILGWVWFSAVVLEEFSYVLSLHHFAMHFCQAINASPM